jgi:hypothetical protein
MTNAEIYALRERLATLRFNFERSGHRYSASAKQEVLGEMVAIIKQLQTTYQRAA